ncbi:hypothetical protein [Jiangella anatolica]|uniref:hypothetical protein n=1 Tax=Jiangella anatolica TaxID=2670374 RepID=UPI0011B77457|nr:hypothetical protein [Jiangella anatolica]
MWELAGSSTRFVGEILVQTRHLGMALDVTRTNDTICLGFRRGDDHEETLHRLASFRDADESQVERTTILRAAVQSIQIGQLIARSFGEFDDTRASTDLFGDRSATRALWKELPAGADEND